MTPVRLSLLAAVFAHMAGRVTYRLGAKAPSLDCDTSAIHEIDCSGFVRYAIARATCGAVVMSDGSVNMRDWCDAHELRRLKDPSDVVYARADPSRLFIVFLKPHGEAPGHVWLVRAGMTMESCGSGGVSSRPWNSRSLCAASAAYELPTEA